MLCVSRGTGSYHDSMACFAHAVIDAQYLSLFHVKQVSFIPGAGYVSRETLSGRAMKTTVSAYVPRGTVLAPAHPLRRRVSRGTKGEVPYRRGLRHWRNRGHQQMTEQASLGVHSHCKIGLPVKVELAADENRRGSESSRCLLLRWAGGALSIRAPWRRRDRRRMSY